MVSWKQFSAASPKLAQLAQAQIFQYGVGLAFLATVRKDGGPRLHPVCPVISRENLYLFILPESPKLADLERNGHYAMQAFPQAKPDSDECYITGKAKRIDDPGVFSRVLSDAKHPADPSEVLFELDIDRVMHTRWEGFGTPEYRSIHEKWTAGE
ncbi:MAG: pyridoxamine 5'-phosphate oxidase family protein [Anaerolineales bacterium]|nr:pyridoxamine 5'-phosphate oxidase family protein [Anaerolineales bacterium]